MKKIIIENLLDELILRLMLGSYNKNIFEYKSYLDKIVDELMADCC
ncbi:hypothetical protein [Vallitalea guaymasensis]|nr:hypothetical protein [Vallitalea guaymasensis]